MAILGDSDPKSPWGDGVAQLVERRSDARFHDIPSDPSSNPVRSTRKKLVSFSESKMLC